MKIGYFSHTNLSVSETFIYDLVEDLNADRDLDLTYYSGRTEGKINVGFELKSVLTGFSEKGEECSYKAFKLGQVIGGKGYKYKMIVQKKRARKTLIKTVTQSIDIAFVDYANSAILLREFFNSKNIPFIVHVHGFDITSSLNDPVYVKELNKVFEEAQFIIVASDHMRRLLVLLGANEDKIKVIRIGIDVESIKPMAWEDRLKQNPSVVFIGRLTEKKHPIALLYAFRMVLNKIPNAKLSIIGDGPLRNEVVSRIKILGIGGAVSLFGSLQREKCFSILKSHWVYAQHSVTAKTGDQEGYALSPAEAAAHELPVVSTLHNGIPEHVIDGETGYLVPEFNYEVMAEKIIYLLKNPQIAEKMGKAGRINIEKLNKQQVRVASIKALFNDVLKSE